MDRKSFLNLAATTSLSSLFPIHSIFESLAMKKNIAIQLFSLPKMCIADFPGTLKMLSLMGYKELELFGPYPFSTQKAKDNWAALGPMVGFNGSGYFDRDIKVVKKLLDDHGLSSPSAHTDLDTLMNNMGALGEAAHTLGHKYVVLPAIPDEYRKTIDDYKKIAETFNKIGEEAKKNGVRFAYHNHGYGIKPKDGVIPLEIIINNTDPELVFLEMDIFWTTAGGADPVQLLSKYPNRYKMLHIKDMKHKATFSGDGGDASQWVALWGEMTTAGDGVLDLKSLFNQANKNRIEHYIVEQDLVADPDLALKKSIDYLKKL